MTFEDEQERWVIFDILTKINGPEGSVNPSDIVPSKAEEGSVDQMEDVFEYLESHDLIESGGDGYSITVDGLQYIADEAGKIRAVESLGTLMGNINEMMEGQQGRGEGGGPGEPGSGGPGGKIVTVGDTDIDGANISAEGGRGGDVVTQSQGCLEALLTCIKRIIPFLD